MEQEKIGIGGFVTILIGIVVLLLLICFCWAFGLMDNMEEDWDGKGPL